MEDTFSDVKPTFILRRLCRTGNCMPISFLAAVNYEISDLIAQQIRVTDFFYLKACFHV